MWGMSFFKSTDCEESILGTLSWTITAGFGRLEKCIMFELVGVQY